MLRGLNTFQGYNYPNIINHSESCGPFTSYGCQAEAGCVFVSLCNVRIRQPDRIVSFIYSLFLLVLQALICMTVVCMTHICGNVASTLIELVSPFRTCIVEVWQCFELALENCIGCM